MKLSNSASGAEIGAMTFDRSEIRRKILTLADTGDSVQISGHPTRTEAEAKSFGRARGIRLRIQLTESGIIATRLAPAQRGAHAYPEIAELEPGSGVLINVPPLSHQRVRVNASQTAARLGRTFRCMREGDAIRVIRTDGVNPEQVAAIPARSNKYNLDRLATSPQIIFGGVPTNERTRLRSACSFKSAQTGWTIRCRLQDDGTMLVYRTDAGAAKQC